MNGWKEEFVFNKNNVMCKAWLVNETCVLLLDLHELCDCGKPLTLPALNFLIRKVQIPVPTFLGFLILIFIENLSFKDVVFTLNLLQ